MERLTDSNKEIPSLKNERKWLDMYFKLKEYEDAEENGLLVRLPCKVGDTVYKVYEDIFRYGVLKNPFDYSDIPDFGNTVFLTQAEAEGKLKEMEGENGC